MTVITGENNIRKAALMALRSAIALHLKVPEFDRTRVLHAARSQGFNGRTLKQAREWIDELCDAAGLDRAAGLPSSSVRHKEGDK